VEIIHSIDRTFLGGKSWSITTISRVNYDKVRLGEAEITIIMVMVSQGVIAKLCFHRDRSSIQRDTTAPSMNIFTRLFTQGDYLRNFEAYCQTF